IMGNPPFVGYSLQSKAQKEDMLHVYVDEKGKPYKKAGKIDYVAGWYFKAAEFLAFPSGEGGARSATDEVLKRSDEDRRNVSETSPTACGGPPTPKGRARACRAAFVSTNSITQGEQVADVWKPLYERFGVHIDFAHRTFRWDSESNSKAHVHVVIVGFSVAESDNEKSLYSGEQRQAAKNISPYLVDAPTVFVESRNAPLCDVPKMSTGNRPADGGALLLNENERNVLLEKEPKAKSYIKRFMGAKEFINGDKRYCLWLVDAQPNELKTMPYVMERVKLCRKNRLEAPDKGRQKLAETPTVFRETKNPEHFIAIPEISSENRKYVPMDFLNKDIIISNRLQMIENATMYHFGILESNVHMAWMKAVCGRLEMRYDYSQKIVYNNFPWPTPTDAQKQTIEQTAQAILDARAKFPDASLADLYDETTMPPELRKAHQANDRAVMAAYGFDTKISEAECVARLMEMYQDLVKNLQSENQNF
ncbi:MAG: hypothetical protein IJ812_02485, partial [Schwartzia sp.]|nr:hypothetical protein [Schwartzia sp. (in: firmicutes)]